MTGQVKNKISKISEAHQWLRWPHITEKAADMTGDNKYTFEVVKKANKFEIAKVIKGLYGVTVIKVNIVNVPRKKRRVRRQIGYKSGYKKAIVTLKEGDKIEVLPH